MGQMFTIITVEHIERHYEVEAESVEDARERFDAGAYDSENEPLEPVFQTDIGDWEEEIVSIKTSGRKDA